MNEDEMQQSYIKQVRFCFRYGMTLNNEVALQGYIIFEIEEHKVVWIIVVFRFRI